uniref:Glyco_18 domain-containing protein n=1 Tax=Caenorhabditis tropicalis TaxID=1561998 RepID=A0A1I7UCG1_9PELO
MTRNRDHNETLLGNVSNSKCSKLNDRPCIVFSIILILCIPISFILAEAFMSCCIDYFVTKPSKTSKIVIETTTRSIITSSPSSLAKNIPAAKCGKRIMNYHKSWSGYIEESKVAKLTHLMFAFIKMNQNGEVSFFDSSDRKNFVDMRTKARKVSDDLKVMISIGGAGQSKHFSSVLSDSRKRQSFIDSISSFLEIHKIDGVDIFWIWPEEKDSDNIAIFAKELRLELTDRAESEERKKPYIISFAYPRLVSHMESMTCLDEIMKYADFINVISYDYFGPEWWPETGPSAPLYSGPKGKDFGNVDSTMRYLACHSKRPSQINMGLQIVGRFWENVKGPIDESDEMWRISEPVNGKTQGGTFSWRGSEEGGFDKTVAVWHNESKSSYIWNPKQGTFISFESERSLMEKMKYVRANNFGGVFLWAIGTDDDDDDTLLNEISSFELCTGEEKDTVKYEC